jgi:flagellar basal-body rod protein FlgC
MSLIPGIEMTSSALNAQKTRLDIIAQNIANAQTTRGPDGQPYQRQVVNFETELLRKAGAQGQAMGGSLQTVRIAGITKDQSLGERVYDPQHPHADASGLVQMPNVKLANEMVDLISATRVYEANLSVARNARQMALKTLEIGK